MDDDDLQKIRQARLQELAQQGGQQSQGGDNKKQQEGFFPPPPLQPLPEGYLCLIPNTSNTCLPTDEARKSVISQILTPEAADRLGRISMVKESRARDLENRLIMMARSNQIRQRITDEELVKLINMLDEQKADESKIVFSRRKGVFDEDDDFYDM